MGFSVIFDLFSKIKMQKIFKSLVTSLLVFSVAMPFPLFAAPQGLEPTPQEMARDLEQILAQNANYTSLEPKDGVIQFTSPQQWVKSPDGTIKSVQLEITGIQKTNSVNPEKEIAEAIQSWDPENTKGRDFVQIPSSKKLETSFRRLKSHGQILNIYGTEYEDSKKNENKKIDRQWSLVILRWQVNGAPAYALYIGGADLGIALKAGLFATGLWSATAQYYLPEMQSYVEFQLMPMMLQSKAFKKLISKIPLVNKYSEKVTPGYFRSKETNKFGKWYVLEYTFMALTLVSFMSLGVPVIVPDYIHGLTQTSAHLIRSDYILQQFLSPTHQEHFYLFFDKLISNLPLAGLATAGQGIWDILITTLTKSKESLAKTYFDANKITSKEYDNRIDAIKAWSSRRALALSTVSVWMFALRDFGVYPEMVAWTLFGTLGLSGYLYSKKRKKEVEENDLQIEKLKKEMEIKTKFCAPALGA